MWSPTSSMMLFGCIAGLLLSGLFLLGVLVGLMRPVLNEVAPSSGWRRYRGFLPRPARVAVLALVPGALLIAAAGVGGTVIGGQSRLTLSESTTTIPSQAIAATKPVVAKREPLGPDGLWLAGDIHSHTYLTGGTFTQAEVADKALSTYRLDWMANSEHGGLGDWRPDGTPARNTPRWWSLINWSWPLIKDLRDKYPGKVLFQGVEWNVPKHGHASVGFAYDDPTVVAEFDYRFDAKSRSTTFPGAPPKDQLTAQSAIHAIEWLQSNYEERSYVVLNHPSRWLTYSAADVRDFLDAGPDVVTGFEGMPGHQKQGRRGGYVWNDPAARTYQGADYWLAQVGGVWDSVLANGYRFHIFANSDFHGTADEFWPGEYTKNWTFVERSYDPVLAVVKGLKSGRSFTAFGDLVDGLRFTAQSGESKAEMSREALLVRPGEDVTVTVSFHTPPVNNNGDRPVVDHLDLIAGNVTGPAVRGTASWEASTSPSARVVASFDRPSFQTLGDNWYGVTYRLENVREPMYLRLRATNIPRNTPNLTDAAGNPLIDTTSSHPEARAWKSLWFYSNPLWIDVRQ